MTKKTKQLAIGLVYQQLLCFLSEYTQTERFNRVPADAPETWPLAYTSRRLLEIWQSAAALLEGETELTEKMERLLAETVYFTRQYEQPGVVLRWKRCNPDLIFFESAFTLLEEDPALYEQIRMGLTFGGLDCYPDRKWIRRRKAYFTAARRRLAREGKEWSRDRVFQEELCRTLTLMFQRDFGDLCPALQMG